MPNRIVRLGPVVELLVPLPQDQEKKHPPEKRHGDLPPGGEPIERQGTVAGQLEHHPADENNVGQRRERRAKAPLPQLRGHGRHGVGPELGPESKDPDQKGGFESDAGQGLENLAGVEHPGQQPIGRCKGAHQPQEFFQVRKPCGGQQRGVLPGLQADESKPPTGEQQCQQKIESRLEQRKGFKELLGMKEKIEENHRSQQRQAAFQKPDDHPTPGILGAEGFFPEPAAETPQAQNQDQGQQVKHHGG